MINDPPAAEIFKEKAKAESKAELEKQVNNSISNIGKLFEETPSNSQKKTKAANTASNVIKTNSAVAVSTNSVNYSKKHKKSKDPYNLETKKLNTQYNNALHSARAKLLRNMFMEYEHVSKQNPQETDNNKLKALSDITLEKKYKEYEKEYEKDMANVNKLGNTIKTRNTQRRTQRQTQRNQSNKNYKESISNIGNLFKNT